MSVPDGSVVPGLAPHVRLRRDEARDRWVLLSPERVFVPDEIALAILQRCDGTRPVAAIVDALAAEYDADRTVIAEDIRAMLADLETKGVVTFRTTGEADDD